jgi:hypothetical protein
LTPATLIGVSGGPIRASAVSTHNDGDFAGDQWSESGAAQKSVAAAIIPSALKLFIVATPSPLTLSVENRKAFHGISLMQIKSGTTTKNPSGSGLDRSNPVVNHTSNSRLRVISAGFPFVAGRRSADREHNA